MGQVSRKHLTAVVVCIAVSFGVAASSAGCGATPRHIATVADNGLYEALNDAHALEQAALCGRPSCAGVPAMPVAGWSLDKSRTFNRRLLPAVDGGLQFNALLASWKPGDPVPQKVHDLIAGMAGSLAYIAADFPDGTTKTSILAKIGTAEALALQAFDLVLAVKGGGR